MSAGRLIESLAVVPNRLAVHLRVALRRMAARLKVEPALTRDFHVLYYGNRWRTWRNTFFLGVPVYKCPLDLWIYQEIIHELKPDLLIECGTAQGGSALFFASLCELVGRGRVISIDISRTPDGPRHPRLEYLVGSSTSHEVIRAVQQAASQRTCVMVVLDSSHEKEHVLAELRLYSPLVTKGSYLIVEDTNLNGHPVRSDFGPGPMEAVQEFLAETDAFVIDTTKEKFHLTFNPHGYLKRVAP